MRDVRRLAKTIMYLGACGLLIGVAVPVLFMCFKKNEARKAFAKAFLIALGVLLVLVIVLGIWIVIDFESAAVTVAPSGCASVTAAGISPSKAPRPTAA